MEDVDIFEINEAFASQASPCFALLPGPPSWRQRVVVQGTGEGATADAQPPSRPSTVWRSCNCLLRR